MFGQVRALIQAAEEDEIGTYAKGAMERVMTGSETTFKSINDANSRYSTGLYR